MPVVYIEGMLQIHGLNIKTQEELTVFENKIKQAVSAVAWASNPESLQIESDVDFETETKAGTFEG